MMQTVEPRSDHGQREDVFNARMAGLVADLRGVFSAGRTRSYEFRVRQLEGLLHMFEQEERAITEALHADVGKPTFEAWLAEVNDAAANVRYTLKHLKAWMAPESVPGTPMLMPAKSEVVREPVGVVLVIAPWNYPFALSIAPVMGALAAGNCVVLKPSEVAPETSRLLARLLPRYLDSETIRVVEGGVPETTALLAQKFDHIFYTGNGVVGRVVMTAAAKHLTPVTLELGGKSPCIVDEDIDLAITARRIVWAKFYNCGQTCVAPDYVLVHRNVHDALIAQLAKTVKEFWGETPQRSADYGRIVNMRHLTRLKRLLDGAGDIVVGGDVDPSDRYLAPTIVRNVSPDCALMREEIFGPVLPVLAIDDIDEAIRFIGDRDKPLALYLFSRNKAVQDSVKARTTSGGMAINHAIVQLLVPELPFGGVGESGMGAYHGRATFETFSHKKAVLTKPQAVDPSLLYPPYTNFKKAILRKLV